MRQLAHISVTVLAIVATIGICAAFVRTQAPAAPAVAPSNVESELRALRKEVKDLTLMTEAFAREAVRIRADVSALNSSRTTIVGDNHDDFLRLMAEYRDNQLMPQARRDLVEAIEKAAKQHQIVGMGVGDCIRVAIDTQKRLYEIRRRIVPPGAMITSVGFWNPSLDAELEELRASRLKSFVGLVGEDAASTFVDAIKDIQPLKQWQWDSK